MPKREYTHWLVLKDCGKYREFRKGQVIKGWKLKTLDGILGSRRYTPPVVKDLVDSGCIKRVSWADLPYLTKPKEKKVKDSKKEKICKFKNSVIY